MRSLVLVLVFAAVALCSVDQQIKNDKTTIDFEGSSGGMKLYPTTNTDGFIQIKQYKIQDGTIEMQIAPCIWSNVVATTALDGTKSWSTYYTKVDGTKNFKLTAWMFETQREIKNGSFSVWVPENSLKFSIDVSGWEVPAGKNLIYAVELSSKKGKDGAMGDKDAKTKKVGMAAGWVDFPTQAFINGVLTDIVVDVDTTASDKMVVQFKFPGPITAIGGVNYDPIAKNGFSVLRPQFLLVALFAVLALTLRNMF